MENTHKILTCCSTHLFFGRETLENKRSALCLVLLFLSHPCLSLVPPVHKSATMATDLIFTAITDKSTQCWKIFDLSPDFFDFIHVLSSHILSHWNLKFQLPSHRSLSGNLTTSSASILRQMKLFGCQYLMEVVQGSYSKARRAQQLHLTFQIDWNYRVFIFGH